MMCTNPQFKKHQQQIRKSARNRKFDELRQVVLKSNLESELRNQTPSKEDWILLGKLGFKKQLQSNNGFLLVQGKIFVPMIQLRERIMRDNHDNPMSGHPGIGWTIGSIKRTFYWL